MPIQTYDGSPLQWRTLRTLRTHNGSDWVPVKKVKAYTGTPLQWRLVWVPPVETASLSFSKIGVNTGEAYNVTLTAPGGFPEGARVTFRFTGYSWSTNPAEGATTATLSGASHATGGTYQWYADVETKGGNTTFGPLSQAVNVPSTNITLSGPAWVLSSSSGAGGASSVTPATFSIGLSNTSVVAKLELQLSYNGGAWTTYQTWNSPVAATVNHSITFSTAGSWRARALVTLTSSGTLASADHNIYCYIKSLSVTTTDSTPPLGVSFTLRATHSGDALASTSGRWQYMYPSNGVWVDNWSTLNPVATSLGTTNPIQFRWAESFSDGSWIISNAVQINPQSTEIVLNGGHCHNIEAKMIEAVNAGKTLRLTGTFYLYTNCYIPSNVNVVATGAKFFVNSKSATEGAAFDSGRFKNDPKGNAAGYGQAGGFTWDGGEFDGNGDGIFTISHSPGFTIKNTTMYRYCATGNTGHAIEINSSGGAQLPDGQYTVFITGNSFLGTNLGQRPNSNDEPLQWDWNWDGPSGGSGGSEPLWRPGDPVSESTQTMCHNLLIENNYFHRKAETGGWQFAICAIGGHDSADASVVASYRHNNIMVRGNEIHGAQGSTSPSPDKGAIHLYRVRQGYAVNNRLYGGVNKRFITAENATDATYCSASGNTSANPTLSNPNTIYVENN